MFEPSKNNAAIGRCPKASWFPLVWRVSLLGGFLRCGQLGFLACY